MAVVEVYVVAWQLSTCSSIPATFVVISPKRRQQNTLGQTPIYIYTYYLCLLICMHQDKAWNSVDTQHLVRHHINLLYYNMFLIAVPDCFPKINMQCRLSCITVLFFTLQWYKYVAILLQYIFFLRFSRLSIESNIGFNFTVTHYQQTTPAPRYATPNDDNLAGYGILLTTT